MKKFIIKILLLLLPLFILAVPMEYLLRQIPNDYSYKRNYLDNNSSKIRTLIFGSSHAYYGLNPIYFSKNTFNASHISQSLDFDFAILNMYEKNLDSLQVIVLPISYFTLWGKLEDGSESWRVKNYIIYYGMHNTNLSDNFELLNNKFLINCFRLYKYYIKKQDDITCTKFGWGTTYKSEKAKDLEKTGKTAADRHTRKDMLSEKHVKIFEDNLKAINSFSEFCNQRNIKLIFLTTPTYHTYRENINAEQYKKMVDTLSNFVNTHSNCFYLNYFEDSDFVAKDFYDADHLNEIGAEKLSRKLSQYIVNDFKIDGW